MSEVTITRDKPAKEAGPIRLRDADTLYGAANFGLGLTVDIRCKANAKLIATHVHERSQATLSPLMQADTVDGSDGLTVAIKLVTDVAFNIAASSIMLIEL